MPKSSEEYELVPLSPIRRLEKRIEILEKQTRGEGREIFKEIVSIIRLNQQIVSELVKANDALRMELARLPSKIEDLTSKLDELLGYIKTAATEEIPPSQPQPELSKKIAELIESNKRVQESLRELVDSLEDLKRKIKRPIILPRKPLITPKPKV